MISVNGKTNVKQIAFAIKGSKSKREIESKGFTGKNIFGNDADAIKFVQQLILHDVLAENIRAMNDRLTNPYISLGKRAQKVIANI